MSRLLDYQDHGPYKCGKGRVAMQNHNGYSTGEYVGPEGVVLIYVQDPSSLGLNYSEGHTRMEYYYKGKQYTRTWSMKISDRYLARTARRFIWSVENA